MQVVLRPGETIVKNFSVGRRLVIFLVLLGIILMVGIPVGILALIPALGYNVSAEARMVAILVGLALGGGLVFYAWYLRVSREYVITNQRIICTLGWLSKATVFTDFQDVTDITIDQDIFQKLVLNIGTDHINTAGGNAQEINFDAVEAPYQIAAMITDLSTRHFAKLGITKATPTIMGGKQPSSGEGS
jgi:hypothetical protein